MKLIEKKCPNCGASLEFSETDRSCKCNYCHRAFEIERDTTKSDLEPDLQFQLSEVKKFTPFMLFAFIPFILIIIIFITAIIIFAINIPNQTHSNNFDDDSDNSIFDFFDNVTENQKENNVLFSDINELSNSDYERIDHDAAMEMTKGEGADYYVIDGKRKREKVYVAYKENSDYIVAVYKTNYYKFPDKTNIYTIYVPLAYENVNKNEFVNKFANPQIKASEYYFNEEKTSYTYGYGSMDEVYNNIIKPLADDGYTITEK